VLSYVETRRMGDYEILAKARPGEGAVKTFLIGLKRDGIFYGLLGVVVMTTI
jgi:hypothetical protein